MHFAALFDFDACASWVDVIPVYPDVVSREAFASPNVAFDFARAFAHLNDIQKTVIFYL